MSDEKNVQNNDNEIIFTGTLVIDSNQSPKQQREKVFQLMQDAGVLVEDPDSLEISFDGVNDNDGLSETQTSDFIVVRKKQKDDSKEMLIQALQAIKDLRSHLDTVNDFDERKKIIDELFEKTDELEKRLGNVSEINEELVQEFDQIDQEIDSVEKSLKEAIHDYQDTSDRLQVVLDEQEKAFNSVMLSEEEINRLREEFATRKMEENQKSVEIQHQITEQRQLLKNLKRKKNKLEKNVEKASSLGMTVSNYEDITDTLQKKSIVNAILEQKGLEDITAKKASERSKEEKKKIKEVKDEIVQEIGKIQEEEQLSILDAIEALYSLKVEYMMNRSPKVLLVKEKQLNAIKDNIVDIPERIVGDAKVYDYTPEEAPEDLKDVEKIPREEVFAGSYLLTDEKMSEEQQRNKIFELMKIAGIAVDNVDDFEIAYEGVDTENPDSTKFVVYRKVKENTNIEESNPLLNISLDDKGVDERIVFFRDMEHEKDVYVRDYVVKRFNIIPDSEPVKIEESLCYRIEENAVKYILGNQHNSYSPYFVEERMVSFPKEEDVVEEVVEKPLEKIVFYQDLDNNYEKYVKQDTIKRFNLIATSDETNIDDDTYYRINEDDALYIIGNQENHYSPYEVEFREAHLGNVNVSKEEHNNEETEIISLYRDVDNSNDVYVKKYVIDRFHFVPLGGEIRIDSNPCYQIENDDAAFLITHANNKYAPYEIEIEDIALGKKLQPERTENVEEIDFYQDLDNNKVIYVKQNVISRFHLQPIGSERFIFNAPCYQIGEDDVNLILEHQDNHYAPYQVNFVEVTLDKDNIENENYGVVERMVLYQKDEQIYAKKYTLKRFNIQPAGDEVRIDGILCYPIDSEAVEWISNLQNNSYSPFRLEIRKMQSLKEKNAKDYSDEVSKIVFYRRGSQVYVKDSELDRFHLKPSGKIVKIDGLLCYPIDNDAVEWITGLQNNQYSPFTIEVRNMIPKNEKVIDKKQENNLEKIVLYNRDGDFYLGEEAIKRFHLENDGKAVKVDGKVCYPVDSKAVEWIKSIQNNQYSPFTIEVRNMIPKNEKDNVQQQENNSEKIVLYNRDGDFYLSEDDLKKLHLENNGKAVKVDGKVCYPVDSKEVEKLESQDSPFTIEVRNMIPKKEQQKEKEEKEVIFFYHINDNPDAVYVDNSVLLKFGVFPAGDVVRYQDKNYYCIRDVDVEKIRRFVSDSKNSSYSIQDAILPISKEKKDNVEEKKTITIDSILDKLKVNNDDVTNKPNFEAKNIKVSHKFLDELKEGSWVYNIIHFISVVRKATQELLHKLSNKFIHTSLEDSLHEFEEKLNQLSDEEMMALLKEYQSVDFVEKVNHLLIEAMNRYVVSKVNDLETIIQDGYDSLYLLLGQVHTLEESLMQNSSNDLKNTYLRERKRLLDRASLCVRDILEARGVAQDILSPEIIASIPDFDNQYPYVGMRFRKELSPELQTLEESYRNNLKDAFKAKDRVEIVSNFLGMENCFYEDSKAANTQTNATVGIRYFDGMVNEFGYQDDSFSRELFHAVADASAKIHEIQRERNHEIQSGTLLGNTSYGTISMDDVKEGLWSFHDDSFADDAFVEINDILLQYSVGNSSHEEVLERVAALEKITRSYLSSLSIEIMEIVKEYEKEHKDFDVVSIEEDLGAIVAKPGIIGEKDLLSASLCTLPNEILKKLVEVSTITQLVIEVNNNIKNDSLEEDYQEEDEVSKRR